jgi:hypothetical protein
MRQVIVRDYYVAEMLHNFIWSRQRHRRDQKGKIRKKILGTIIIKILNKKGLTI